MPLKYKKLVVLFSMGIMLMHKFPVVFLEMKIPCVRQIMGTGVLGGFLVNATAISDFVKNAKGINSIYPELLRIIDL